MTTIDLPEVQRRLHHAETIARRAGERLMAHLGRLPGYREKSAIDLVTIADEESEALIAHALRADFSADALMLEEEDGRAGAEARRSEFEAAPFTWCVDPLDGTTNFVHGFPVFAVSIGLLAHGRPVGGVVHAPALGETYVGGLGAPAKLNGAPIRVSAVETLARALLATGFPYDRRARIDALLRRVRAALLAAHDLRRAGSAALDLCFVAAGRLDGYFELGLAPWDMAAGIAIVEAAGGAVSRADGAPVDLFAADVVATNGALHDALRSLLADADA